MESPIVNRSSNGNAIKGKESKEDEKLRVPLLNGEKESDTQVFHEKEIEKRPPSALYTPEGKQRTVSKNGSNGDDDQQIEGVKFFGIGDDDSICSSESNHPIKSKIPDGGWGWVVVAAAFVISTIADGLAFSFGILHLTFTEEFGESQAKTAWIGSLFISVPLIAGPIMSALVDRYGCRSMTIVGGVVSTIGFLLAAVSRSIEMIFLTFGVLAGLGLGLCYVTAVVSIAYWFDKKRNLAVSLGACGIGFGTVIYSPLTILFLDNYGWRGAIVMLAGTLLNICVCGAVMRDPEWLKEERKNRSKLRAASTTSISAKSARSAAESMYPLEEIRSLLKSGESPEYILTKLATSIAVAENLDQVTKLNADGGAQPKVSSVISLPTFLKQSERLPIEVLESMSSNKRLYNIILENYPSLLALRSNSEQKLPIEEPPTVPKNKPVTMSMKLKSTKKKEEDKPKVDENTLVVPAMKKLDLKTPQPTKPFAQDWWKRHLANQHYLRDLRLQKHSMVHRGAMMNITKYKLRASSCPNIYRNSMLSLDTDEGEKKWYTKAWEEFKSTFDFQMLCEFHFFLMNMSTILLFIWFIVPYFFLVTLVTENGYDTSTGGDLITVIGAANTIGIVVLGWAGDQPWINVTKTYAVCLFLCGICVLVYPLILPNYWMLIANSAIFGLTFASSYSYTPTILVELVALEKFTIAYGLILLSQGIGHLIGPPMAGLMFDKTKTWNLSFHVAGAWIIVSGLLVGIIPFTENFRMCGSAPLEKDAERISQASQKQNSFV